MLRVRLTKKKNQKARISRGADSCSVPHVRARHTLAKRGLTPAMFQNSSFLEKRPRGPCDFVLAVLRPVRVAAGANVGKRVGLWMLWRTSDESSSDARRLLIA